MEDPATKSKLARASHASHVSHRNMLSSPVKDAAAAGPGLSTPQISASKQRPTVTSADAQPDRISVFLPWRLGRQEAAAYATRGDRDARNAPRPRHTRGGRDVRYARTIINAHHVSQAWMQSSRALHVPNYTAQALRARGKRAVFLPHAFGLQASVTGWTFA